MFYVYIIKSSKDTMLYIGSTNNLNRRLKEHAKGLVKSSKIRRPFRLVYFEAFASEKEARKREQNLKLHGRARRQLLNRIKESLETN
jgi:putative endonuclease